MLRFDSPPWRHHHHHRVGGGGDDGAGGGGGILAIVQQQLLIATLLLLPMTLVLPPANAYSILDVLKLTGTTSTATCPAECTLCSCLDITSSSTTSARGKLIDECTQTKSIEACRLNTLDECFLRLLFPASSSSTTTTGSSGGATKDNVDITGLCAIQCPTTEGAARPGTAIQCRLCDIFTCCGTCPTSMADQCFPPPPTTTGGGYTPTGWEPLLCDSPTDTGGGSGGKSSSSAKGWRGGSGGIVFLALILLLPWWDC